MCVAVPDRNQIFILLGILSASPSLMHHNTELLLRVGLICAM